MDLFEVEGKQLMTKYGIRTDSGILYTRGIDLLSIGFPCAVKAQTLSGKRGKSGGIRFAENPDELLQAVELIENIRINGRPAEGIYIAPKIKISREHYLGITLDLKNRTAIILYSRFGGMDIEQISLESPEKLMRFPVEEVFDAEAFLLSLLPFQEHADKICAIAKKLHKMFFELDATTIEINPLAELEDGSFIAVDSKVVIDDNALFRQGEYTVIPREKSGALNEKEALLYGLAYVELESDGNIGIIAGGAGIGMATMDTVKYYGAKPFNFMDLGGGVTTEKTYAAVRLLLDISQVEGILVNVFGGINNCYEIAKGVTDAIKDSGSETQFVVKSRGFSQEEGWALYTELGLGQVHYGTTDDAVRLLISKLAGKKEAAT